MNPSTALATVLVDELVRCGVREAVLCPGSRSAPLAYALQEADRGGRLRLHVRVDERSAGFLALGLAKVTRTPAAVVTTSGTAVANLHPAVLEAHHGQVPLLVLSADRPPELRGTGANQTTTQVGMFGSATRWAQELGAPERRLGQVSSWRSSVCRAVAASRGRPGGVPGPVHLNVPLREPLVPTADGVWPDELEGRPDGAPWVEVLTSAPGHSRPLDPLPRTVVVVGDLPEPGLAETAITWARESGWPVVAEPFGAGAEGVVPHGPLLLGVESWLADNLPERVVTVGRITLARPVARLLRRQGVRVEAVAASPEWADPGHVVSAVHGLGVLHHPVPCEDPRWTKAWREAGDALAAAVARAGLPWPTGLAVAQAVLGAVPHGSLLFVGSSNAVRDLDLSGDRTSRAAVVANRGLAGIDGCVSTAVGVALAAGAPTYALLGDLTFLHDANGLLVGPHEPQPDLTLVVANDDGGGIFTLLEPGQPERADDFERVFGTPTGTHLAALCAAHGVAHQKVESRDALVAAVAQRPHGLRVLEVEVDRTGHRAAHERLRRVAAEALAATGGAGEPGRQR
ncbi:2-succinyl-5-enolpyruvyl-6-hydroxy-3-cyclohexene-1-carboxylic-acid synthase [Knoellia sp. p5-6-4]|uniref:2-succinyl-5-enolpyruvyl-6-hydroxy-3- cyclohexene-1-carboxylic-acid synthase n=1 Tax=unclassified Knoellia TaxID=2618719 RepID=UPI0023DBAAAE|nr:2-succinyl-5-enolpyruvyl-6-hydroxy-3-cyclohexene-1-carboxylic-acid synthase [Knoellia sp. p5-6-4]MDF2144519.1 2-succinyl-5-enolpyruvyl-6-hydroxy-3-cyclohexene-1-carboxylic-acid synthase [Knoellia sp. p5-6-4]